MHEKQLLEASRHEYTQIDDLSNYHVDMSEINQLGILV